GLVVQTLPTFVTVIARHGQILLYANDVYYRPRPDVGGYEIVNDPAEPELSAEGDGSQSSGAPRAAAADAQGAAAAAPALGASAAASKAAASGGEPADAADAPAVYPLPAANAVPALRPGATAGVTGAVTPAAGKELNHHA